MRCVVTGGAGFIGSNLVDALVERGDEVTIIDAMITGKRENLEGALAQGASLAEVNLTDADAVSEVFAEARPESVFHLGAQIDVRMSVEDPGFDATTNVLGTIAVLEAARASGALRVVNTSTGGGLYGDADVLPTPEDQPIRPLAPYGQSKYAAEGYVELYHQLFGLSSLSVRYGNVYGPRQDVHGEAGVVAIFCGLAISGGTPTIYGDGLQTRDWVEVSDVVAANLLAADSDISGAVNIGHGQETSVLDLIEALNAVADPGLAEPVFAPARAGEVRRSCLDVTRARTELRWEPQVGLHAGLTKVLASLL
jgi:UDP-glucose 4-epimerase